MSMDLPVTQNKSDVPVNQYEKPSAGPLAQFELENRDCEKNARREIKKLDREADKHLLNGDIKQGIKALEESIHVHDQAALPTDKLYVHKVLVLATLLEKSNPSQPAKANRYKDKAVDALMSHRTVGSDIDALGLLARLTDKEPKTREEMNSHIKRISKVIDLIDRSDEKIRKVDFLQPFVLERLGQKLVKSEILIGAKEQVELSKAFGAVPIIGELPETLPRKTEEIVDKLSSRIDDLAGKGPKEKLAEQRKDLERLREEMREEYKKWAEEMKKRPISDWFKDN
jgi:hypothetical protein